MTWQQGYNPFGNMILSTLIAAIPVVVMLVGLGFMHLKAHVAAAIGLVAALAVAGVLGRGPIVNGSGWPLLWQFLRAAVHPELGRSTVALAAQSTFITLAFALCGTSLALVLGLVGGVLSSEVLWRPHAAEGGRWRRLRYLGWTAVRALLAVPRAIHEMIWGLFLVNVLGLDPLVAVLAIALPDRKSVV